jgi:hypothetical protein
MLLAALIARKKLSKKQFLDLLAYSLLAAGFTKPTTKIKTVPDHALPVLLLADVGRRNPPENNCLKK